MPKHSNWPDGIDRSHPNFTLRTPGRSKYDGMGAYAPNSSKIPLLPALGFTAVCALFVWCIFKLPLLIWG